MISQHLMVCVGVLLLNNDKVGTLPEIILAPQGLDISHPNTLVLPNIILKGQNQ